MHKRGHGSGSRERMTGMKGSGSRAGNRSADIPKIPGEPGYTYPTPGGMKSPQPLPIKPTQHFGDPFEPGGGDPDGVRRRPGESTDSIRRRREKNRKELERERDRDRKPKPAGGRGGGRGGRGGKIGKGK
jgi:hypothetical protein